MDQTYVHKLQYMSLNGTGSSPEQESPYGRIIPKNDTNHHSKQRSLGAIESFAVDGTTASPQKPSNDYKIYERNNIIAASKFATPKQVETIASTQKVANIAGGYNGTDIYVQCAKPQVRRPPSPTNSLSGSSQHSNSPRHSMAASNYDEYTVLKNQPLYENIDYYSNQGPSAYYHQIPTRNPADGVKYESSFRKAQPQVPTGNKSVVHEVEQFPLYENLQELNHKPSDAQPGPQVLQSAGPPPYSTMINYGNATYSSPQHQVIQNVQPHQIIQNVPQHQVIQNVQHQAIQNVQQHQVMQNVPQHQVIQNVPQQKSHYAVMQAVNVKPTTNNATNPYYHHHTSPVHQIQSQSLPTPKSPTGRTFTQKQLEELNSSDYVCMTGNISQTLLTNTHIHTSLSTSYAHGATSGIAGVPKSPPKEAPKPITTVLDKSPSPTPSTASNTSGKLKVISGKTLLPYNVTPPRPRGPTEAEKKIEEMTRQLEEEMEKQEEEGEYFGKFN